MNITERTASNGVLNTFTQLDVQPPKAITDAHARADKLADGTGWLTARPGDLESAVAAAILADRDPTADPEVQRATTAIALSANHGLAESVAAAGLDGVRQAAADNLDEIIALWSGRFDEAAGILTDAHARIGGLSLDDTHTILAKGGDAADAWASATNAVSTINVVLNGWTNTMALLHVSLDPRHRPFKMAALSLEQWRTLPAKLSPWEALQAGVTLSLPTLAEYRRRIATVEQAQADEQADQEAASMDSLKTIDPNYVARIEAARQAEAATAT